MSSCSISQLERQFLTRLHFVADSRVEIKRHLRRSVRAHNSREVDKISYNRVVECGETLGKISSNVLLKDEFYRVLECTLR